MVDVVHQRLEDSRTDVLQLNVAVISLSKIRGEHGPEKAALCRQHQAVKLELLAVHSDDDICKQAVFQTQVHDALYHTAGMGAISEGIALKVVLIP